MEYHQFVAPIRSFLLICLLIIGSACIAGINHTKFAYADIQEEYIEKVEKNHLRKLKQSGVINNQLYSLRPSYQPAIELHLKGGNRRGIGQLGLILPILQNRNTLFYLSIFGMFDTQHSREGNFGLGVRRMLSQSIIGAYGFYDRRRTKFNTSVQQLTFGVELLMNHFEIRGNGYLPENKRRVLSSQTQNELSFHGSHTLVKTINQQRVAIPMRGFDVEIGGSLPQLERVNTFLSYYYFTNKGANKISGYRVRSNLRLWPWLSLEGEFSYDKVRKSNYFLGAKLSWSPNREQTRRHFNKLDSKMTQLPIRDIDIIVSPKDELTQTERKMSYDSENYVILRENQPIPIDNESYSKVGYARVRNDGSITYYNWMSLSLDERVNLLSELELGENLSQWLSKFRLSQPLVLLTQAQIHELNQLTQSPRNWIEQRRNLANSIFSLQYIQSHRDHVIGQIGEIQNEYLLYGEWNNRHNLGIIDHHQLESLRDNLDLRVVTINANLHTYMLDNRFAESEMISLTNQITLITQQFNNLVSIEGDFYRDRRNRDELSL